ncbi:MAG TPA: YaeQ family protein [Candidatus Polarisedimenticolia bacterium]|nr:YaeQ family protein [Candidatus Polarisedimenticolia bacterium]
MALTATIHTFEIELADADRGMYGTMSFRAARHPSESEEGFVVRVLAYSLERAEGIAFSKGLDDPDEPAIAVRDLTGAIRVWIEIGAPSAARVHKASKAAGRVAIYTHKDPEKLLRQYSAERIHRAADVELYSLDPRLVGELAHRLERRMVFSVSVTGERMYVTLGEISLEGALARHRLPGPARPDPPRRR